MRLAVVIMGVSGCGKSAVAEGVARRLGLRAIDSDNLHAPEAVARMRAGTPPTYGDRWPWLDHFGAVLADATASPPGAVMACSALRWPSLLASQLQTLGRPDIDESGVRPLSIARPLAEVAKGVCAALLGLDIDSQNQAGTAFVSAAQELPS